MPPSWPPSGFSTPDPGFAQRGHSRYSTEQTQNMRTVCPGFLWPCLGWITGSRLAEAPSCHKNVSHVWLLHGGPVRTDVWAFHVFCLNYASLLRCFQWSCHFYSVGVDVYWGMEINNQSNLHSVILWATVVVRSRFTLKIVSFVLITKYKRKLASSCSPQY